MNNRYKHQDDKITLWDIIKFILLLVYVVFAIIGIFLIFFWYPVLGIGLLILSLIGGSK